MIKMVLRRGLNPQSILPGLKAWFDDYISKFSFDDPIVQKSIDLRVFSNLVGGERGQNQGAHRLDRQCVENGPLGNSSSETRCRI